MKKQMYINGEWVAADGDKTYDLKSPANGEIIAQIADGGAGEVKRAAAAAKSAFPLWAKRSAKERGAILKKAEGLLLSRADEIGKLISQENGKPYAEAKEEVKFSAGYLSWFAEEGRRAYGRTIPSPIGHKRLSTVLQPVGVVGAITPWNFPANMITRKIAPALAAGCTVILKPAEDTPLTALAIAQVLHDAGVPPGVFNIVTAKDPRPISAEYLTNPDIRMIGFTGSIGVGKLLMEQSAKQLKKLSLELGGNAPVIVFDDAHIDKAVERAVSIKFLRVGGESCICANRIFVQEKIYPKFLEKFLAKVQSLKVGDPFDEGVQIGPLINAKALDRITQLIEETKKRGAQILLGGHRLTEGKLSKGNFYAPTILTGAQDDWPICQNEIFGPVANLLVFKTEEEAIARANRSNYGLASYVFTQDVCRAIRLSEALEYGFVGINEGEGYTHEIPMGGFKESGIGREGGAEGLHEYMEVKSILFNIQ